MKAVKMGACNTQVDSTQQLHSVTRITLHKDAKKTGWHSIVRSSHQHHDDAQEVNAHMCESKD